MRIRLKEIIDHQKVSIYALSKEIGVSQNNLAKIIKGETTSIKYEILEKLCVALKIAPNDIFVIDYPYPIALVQDTSNSSFIAYNEYLENLDPDEEPFDIYSCDEETIAEYEELSAQYAIKSDLRSTLDESISKLIVNIVDTYLLNITIDEHIKFLFKDYKTYDYFSTGYKVKRYYDKLSDFLNKRSNDKNLLNLLSNIKELYEKDTFEKLTNSDILELQKQVNYYINNNTDYLAKD